MLFRDGLIHLPGYAAVAEVASDAGAEFGDVEGFGEVHLEERAATSCQWEEILRRLRGLGNTAVAQGAVGGVDGGESFAVDGGEARFGEGGLAGADGLVVAGGGGVGLEELDAAAMAVHVAEAADVHEDVEAKAVAGRETAEELVVTAAMFGAE